MKYRKEYLETLIKDSVEDVILLSEMRAIELQLCKVDKGNLEEKYPKFYELKKVLDITH